MRIPAGCPRELARRNKQATPGKRRTDEQDPAAEADRLPTPAAAADDAAGEAEMTFADAYPKEAAELVRRYNLLARMVSEAAHARVTPSLRIKQSEGSPPGARPALSPARAEAHVREEADALLAQVRAKQSKPLDTSVPDLVGAASRRANCSREPVEGNCRELLAGLDRQHPRGSYRQGSGAHVRGDESWLSRVWEASSRTRPAIAWRSCRRVSVHRANPNQLWIATIREEGP